jgi:hypothetical protein
MRTGERKQTTLMYILGWPRGPPPTVEGSACARTKRNASRTTVADGLPTVDYPDWFLADEFHRADGVRLQLHDGLLEPGPRPERGPLRLAA